MSPLLAAEMQAIDRTHRLGQHKPIFATRFIIGSSAAVLCCAVLCCAVLCCDSAPPYMAWLLDPRPLIPCPLTPHLSSPSFSSHTVSFYLFFCIPISSKCCPSLHPPFNIVLHFINLSHACMNISAENTIEERILKLQEKKKLVFDGTVGGDAGSIARLTVDDMRFLFQ